MTGLLFQYIFLLIMYLCVSLLLFLQGCRAPKEACFQWQFCGRSTCTQWLAQINQSSSQQVRATERTFMLLQNTSLKLQPRGSSLLPSFLFFFSRLIKFCLIYICMALSRVLSSVMVMKDADLWISSCSVKEPSLAMLYWSKNEITPLLSHLFLWGLMVYW